VQQQLAVEHQTLHRPSTVSWTGESKDDVV
jgi:hypothetical protein